MHQLNIASFLAIVTHIFGSFHTQRQYFDSDGDGTLSLAEALAHMDQNDDGRISVKEFLSAARAAHSAPAPVAPSEVSVAEMPVQGTPATDAMAYMGARAMVAMANENGGRLGGGGEENQEGDVEVQMRPKNENQSYASPLKRRSSVTDKGGMAIAQLQRQGSLKKASDVRQMQEHRTTLSQHQFQRHSQELTQRQHEVKQEANEKQLAEENAAMIAKNRREARERWKEVVLPMPWEV